MNPAPKKSIQKLIDKGRIALFDNRNGKRPTLPKGLLALRTKARSRKASQIQIVAY
jgi:hypothetical protein